MRSSHAGSATPTAGAQTRPAPPGTAAAGRTRGDTSGRCIHLEGNVLGQDIGDTARYGHDGLRSDGRPAGQPTAPSGSYTGSACRSRSQPRRTGAPTPNPTTTCLVGLGRSPVSHRPSVASGQRSRHTISGGRGITSRTTEPGPRHRATEGICVRFTAMSTDAAPEVPGDRGAIGRGGGARPAWKAKPSRLTRVVNRG